MARSTDEPSTSTSPTWLFEAAADDGARYASVTTDLASSSGGRARRAQSQILEAAWALFRDQGFGPVTMEEIARRAAVSRPAVYSYFPSKRSIFVALAVAVNSRYQAEVRRFAEIQPNVALEDAVAHWVGDYVAFLEETYWLTLVWDEVAAHDERLQAEGLRHEKLAWLTFGSHMGILRRGAMARDPLADGLVVLSMFERVWFYWSLARAPVTRSVLEAQLTTAVVALIG